MDAKETTAVQQDKTPTAATTTTAPASASAPTAGGSSSTSNTGTSLAATTAASNGTPVSSIAQTLKPVSAAIGRAPALPVATAKPMASKYPTPAIPVVMPSPASVAAAALNMSNGYADAVLKNAEASLISGGSSAGGSTETKAPTHEGSTETKAEPVQPISDETKSSKKWWIIGGIAGGAVLIAAVVIIIVKLKRR